MKKLPDNPADLIRLAIDDLEKTEQDSRYVVDMHQWHKPDSCKPRFGRTKHYCRVCLAGSVIAQRLSPDEYRTSIYPNDYGSDTHRKLLALNSFRGGYIGLLDMNRGAECEPVLWKRLREHVPTNTPVTPYAVDPKKFKADMRALADRLDEAMKAAGVV